MKCPERIVWGISFFTTFVASRKRDAYVLFSKEIAGRFAGRVNLHLVMYGR
jgi:hypothetical protein